ncbi:MAG: restriction endonuclease subunit S [Sphaerochaetaceae bacterium]
MEKHIPKGYKKTEVGVIPEDWVVTSLKKISVIKRGASPRPINSPRWFSNQGRGWVRISDVTKANTYLMNVSQHLSPIGEQNSVAVEASDLIMSICATVGVPIILGIPACIHDGFVLFKNYEQILEKMFFFYFLKNYSSSASSKGQSGTQKNLNTSIVGNILIPVPQKTEQKAIATALSDVDNLITSLEQLIEKKKAIKQGTMQELLTGRRRLKGFGKGKGHKQTELGMIPEDWEIKSFGDVLSVKHGKSQKEVEIENGKYPILATGGIIGWSNSYLANTPSVLIGRKGTIDKPQYMDTPFWTVDTLFYTEINPSNCAKYLYYLFKLIPWYSYNEASGVPSLNATTIEKIRKAFPSTKREQEVISEALTLIDSEIENLEAKVDKYKQIKQGMMQNLLTGRIRLV